MNNFFALCKGSSGTGKSTRVAQLLNFLKERFESEVVYYNFNGVDKKFGILFKEFNLIFIGKEYKRNGITAFQSLDYINGFTKKSEVTCDILKEYLQTYSLIGEGEPLLKSFRYRPKYIYEEYGIKRIFILYYVYDKREEYDERIKFRSGEIAKTNSAWDRNHQYISDWQSSKKELDDLVLDESYLDLKPYNYDQNDFGVKLLLFIKREDLISEFIEYTKKFPVTWKYKEEKEKKNLW